MITRIFTLILFLFLTACGGYEDGSGNPLPGVTQAECTSNYLDLTRKIGQLEILLDSIEVSRQDIEHFLWTFNVS